MDTAPASPWRAPRASAPDSPDGGCAREHVFTVRDGDVAAIKAGYHPVVAAPGYSLYYLWVMAGQGREMVPYLDPQHAWVQTGS